MASFGPVQRPSITASSMAEKDSSSYNPLGSSPDHQKDPNFTFNFTCLLSIPSTPETAAARIVKNAVSFGLLYLHFVYVVLFIALIPQRKVSLVYLVGAREIGFLFLLFLRAVPKSFLPNYYKSVCKILALFILCVLAAVAMILTKSGIHLLIVLVSTAPVILVHAVLWKEDFGLGRGGGDDAGEKVPIMVAEGDESSNSV